MSQDNARAYPSPPSHVHDIVTGGVEGGIGILATEPLLAKLGGEKVIPSPLRGGIKGIGRRFGAGAVVGAGATGLIGALVSMGEKRKKTQSQPVGMDRITKRLIEFAYDQEAPLRKGYRLDKYQKTIRSHEIDRKLSNTTRAAGWGAAVGAALPGSSLKGRALIGAGVGAATAIGSQLASPNDEYGEESETAKLAQHRLIQVGAAGGLAYAGYRRKEQLTDLLRRATQKLRK